MSKIFNISEAATIGLHAMALIAKNPNGLNALHIAEITGFSKNHISKILQQLVKNGLLTSTRGPKGGFVLKKEADEITLMDIYILIEGDIDYNTGCKINCNQCPFKNCKLQIKIIKFSQKYFTTFSQC